MDDLAKKGHDISLVPLFCDFTVKELCDFAIILGVDLKKNYDIA